MNVFTAMGTSLRGTLAVGMLLLPALTGVAQAQRRQTQTAHVPDAVGSGVAPLVGRLAASQHVHLAISLPLRNQADLENFLADLYDQRSPNFRRYLSVQEFADKFGPSSEDYAALQKSRQTMACESLTRLRTAWCSISRLRPLLSRARSTYR